MTAEPYRGSRQRGTEAPFTGKYYAHKDSGMYSCVVCGEEPRYRINSASLDFAASAGK